MQEQNYKNHARMVTGFHYVLFGLLLVTIICSFGYLYLQIESGESNLVACILILLTISVILVAWYSRVFALKAQDRAIRAEENFRHFILTGKPLDGSLKMSQITALRFASDTEFVALAQKAVSENLTNKDIKKQVQNWKADHNRA